MFVFHHQILCCVCWVFVFVSIVVLGFAFGFYMFVFGCRFLVWHACILLSIDDVWYLSCFAFWVWHCLGACGHRRLVSVCFSLFGMACVHDCWPSFDIGFLRILSVNLRTHQFWDVCEIRTCRETRTRTE